jgi:hypothetical protein
LGRLAESSSTFARITARGMHPRLADDTGTIPQDYLSVPPAVCYNHFPGFQTAYMRTVTRFLAILTVLALLAPSVRWASLRSAIEACTCLPGACMCASHHHSLGRTPGCGMGKGGQCGMESHDSYVNSLLSSFIYVPTERSWPTPLPTWSFGRDTSETSLLAAHVRLPEQPPRATL